MAAGPPPLGRRGGEDAVLIATAALPRPARSTAGHRIKRWLYLIHRWIGIASCLLFAMWFASGLVMVYVPFPSLTQSERLAGLPPIDWSRVRVPPAQSATLEMRGTLPVWRISKELTISAVDARTLPAPDAREATAIAEGFGHARAVSVESVTRDQWTVPGSFDVHRPLWKVRLAGSDARELYVSGRSGAVVLDSTRPERFWNWLGSVPHWLYPTVLRQNQPAWRQTVLWVSGPCILVAITGMWIGILRTRLGKRRFKGGRMTPYHGWMLWHHVAGLLGGITLTTWIISGWLSVDPGRLFASPGIPDAAATAFVGDGPFPVIGTRQIAAKADGARQVQATWAAGRPLLIVARKDRPPQLLDAATLALVAEDRPRLVARAAALMPDARIVSVERLTAPDAYWYEVAALPRLPVLRVKFDDPAATWVHIDPRSGELLGQLDRRRRVYRWAFDLLHKWDLNGLTLNRPLWDGLLWLLSLVGLVTSVSAIVLGWRRLRRPARTPATG